MCFPHVSAALGLCLHPVPLCSCHPSSDRAPPAPGQRPNVGVPPARCPPTTRSPRNFSPRAQHLSCRVPSVGWHSRDILGTHVVMAFGDKHKPSSPSATAPSGESGSSGDRGVSPPGHLCHHSLPGRVPRVPGAHRPPRREQRGQHQRGEQQPPARPHRLRWGRTEMETSSIVTVTVTDPPAPWQRDGDGSGSRKPPARCLGSVLMGTHEKSHPQNRPSVRPPLPQEQVCVT